VLGVVVVLVAVAICVVVWLVLHRGMDRAFARGQQEAIALHLLVQGSPDDAIVTWQQRRTDWLAQAGLLPVGQTADAITYENTYTPRWAIVVSILLFPIGLIAGFLVRNVERLVVRFDPKDDATLLTITGTLARGRGAWLSGLTQEYEPFTPARPTPGA
jgi:hypothetical protein